MEVERSVAQAQAMQSPSAQYRPTATAGREIKLLAGSRLPEPRQV